MCVWYVGWYDVDVAKLGVTLVLLELPEGGQKHRMPGGWLSLGASAGIKTCLVKKRAYAWI